MSADGACENISLEDRISGGEILKHSAELLEIMTGFSIMAQKHESVGIKGLCCNSSVFSVYVHIRAHTCTHSIASLYRHGERGFMSHYSTENTYLAVIK